MAERREAKYNRYPAWAPRFWHGMRFGDWLGLLIRNRFRIHPFRLRVWTKKLKRTFIYEEKYGVLRFKIQTAFLVINCEELS